MAGITKEQHMKRDGVPQSHSSGDEKSGQHISGYYTKDVYHTKGRVKVWRSDGGYDKAKCP